MIPLSAPEIRRLLRALGEDPAQFRFRLAWSHWRRRHQAVARCGHRARRARRLAAAPAPALAVLPWPPSASSVGGREVLSADLSAAEWARILPLLPPEKPRRGRPAHAHRPLVAAMIWVERTGAAWRQVPAHVGPWHRVYNRYRLWRRSGLWARIVAALAPQPAGTASLTRAHAPPDARAAA
jgi:transposase